jgi:hypothetical protein
VSSRGGFHGRGISFFVLPDSNPRSLAFARDDKEVCHPEGSSTPEGSRSCFVFSQLRNPPPPGMLPPLRSVCSASAIASAREDKEVCHPEGSSTPEGSRSCFVFSRLRNPSPPGMLPPLRSGCSASAVAFAREDKEVCHPEGSSTPEGPRSCFVLPNCEILPLRGCSLRFALGAPRARSRSLGRTKRFVILRAVPRPKDLVVALFFPNCEILPLRVCCAIAFARDNDGLVSSPGGFMAEGSRFFVLPDSNPRSHLRSE